MQADPWRVREIHDDLESCFWVLLFIAVQHIKTSAHWPYLDRKVFSGTLFARFENGVKVQYSTRPGEDPDAHAVGWIGKVEALTSENGLKMMKWRCRSFNTLMKKLTDIFSALLRPLETQAAVEKSDGEDLPSMATPLEERRRALAEHKFLKEPENLLKIFYEALAQDGWLDGDAVPRMLPMASSAWKRYERQHEGKDWPAEYQKHIRGQPSCTRYPPWDQSEGTENECGNSSTHASEDAKGPRPVPIPELAETGRKRRGRDNDYREDQASKRRK